MIKQKSIFLKNRPFEIDYKLSTLIKYPLINLKNIEFYKNSDEVIKNAIAYIFLIDDRENIIEVNYIFCKIESNVIDLSKSKFVENNKYNQSSNLLNKIFILPLTKEFKEGIDEFNLITKKYNKNAIENESSNQKRIYRFNLLDKILNKFIVFFHLVVIPIFLFVLSISIYFGFIEFYGYTIENIDLNTLLYSIQYFPLLITVIVTEKLFFIFFGTITVIILLIYMLDLIPKIIDIYIPKLISNIKFFNSFYLDYLKNHTQDFLIFNTLSIKFFLKELLTIFKLIYVVFFVIIIVYFGIDIYKYIKIQNGDFKDFNQMNRLFPKFINDSYIDISIFPKLQIINQNNKALVMGYDNHFLYYYDFKYIKDEINSTKVKDRICNNYDIFKDKNITSSTLLTHYLFGIFDNENLKIDSIKKVEIINDKNTTMLNELNLIINNIDCNQLKNN